MLSDNIQIQGKQTSMKSKNQFSKASTELLQKLQQLNLSSSSSDSFDSEFKQPFMNALKLEQQIDIEKPSLKQNNFFADKSNENKDQIIQKQIISKIIQNQLKVNAKLADQIANKENVQINNFSTVQSDTERSFQNLFNEGRDQFKRISQRLKTSPSLQKKLIDKSLEEEEDPFKIYDKLKENISKEITLSKQRNEQYLNEITNLQNELMNLKLQEVEFEKGFLLSRHQPKENKIFTFNNMPNNEQQTHQKLQEIIQNSNENLFNSEPQSLTHIQNKFPKSQQIKILNSSSINYKVPFQFRSISTFVNSNKFDKNDRNYSNKSLQLFQNEKQNNSTVLNQTNQNVNSYDHQNNQQVQQNQIQPSYLKNYYLKDPLLYGNNENVFYPNNTIIQQQQLQQTKQNYQFVSLLQNGNSPEMQQINIMQKMNDQPLDVSQENDIQYDYFKPIYNNNSIYLQNQSIQSKEQNSSQDKQKFISSQFFQQQSSSEYQKENHEHQTSVALIIKDAYQSPLQNIKIKEQEQISQFNKISKVQKKLDKLINPNIQKSKYEAALKKKSHSLKSLEQTQSYKDQLHTVTNSINQSRQSPKKIKNQANIKEEKQDKKMKSFYEQTQSNHISQQSIKKKKETSSQNNLQQNKMNSPSNIKSQSILPSKQDVKKKAACKECLNLLRKNISTTFCTQKHNQKNQNK